MPNLAKMKALLEDAKAAYKAQFTEGFYHGSPSPNIKAFDPTKGTKPPEWHTPGVTFVTKSTDFAHDYVPGKATIEKMVGQPDQYMTGATIYPVSVNLGKHFDPATAESQQVVADYIAKKHPNAMPDELEVKTGRMMDRLTDPINNWGTMEHPEFLQHLRDTGHDSFAVTEAAVPNVGVLKPQNIRGKFAQYNPEDAESTDFMKAEGGSVGHYAPGGQVMGALARFLEESKIPQRLYHGTTVSEKGGAEALSQLKQSKEGALGAGIYMTPNPEFASHYASDAGGYVMPVHTNLRNPLEIHTTTGGGDPMKAALMQLGVDENEADKIIEKAYDTRGYIGKEVMSRAQKQGYDGLAQYHDGNLSEVVSYNPYSIKSATGNSGEFNPYDPRLSKADGGAIRKLAHAVTVPFTHFSPKADLTALDPRKYGTGMKGAEAARLANAADIAPRSYFYHGDNIVPESGVGGNKYTGVSQNSYPISKDPGDFYTKSRTNDPYLMQMGITQHSPEHTINNMERMIKDAGYSGYHTDTGTGVLFNDTPVIKAQ